MCSGKATSSNYFNMSNFFRPTKLDGAKIIDIPRDDFAFSIYSLKALHPFYTFFEVQSQGFMIETRLVQ